MNCCHGYIIIPIQTFLGERLHVWKVHVHLFMPEIVKFVADDVIGSDISRIRALVL